MPVITRSITVDAPVATVFEISNRVEKWPEMIPEYLEVELLRTEGRKIWFRLTNKAGATWTSWRMLYAPYVAYAERHDPLAPFTFNQITWSYHALPGNRTQMTWDMFFELEEGRAHESDAFHKLMDEHTSKNQSMMRQYIESLPFQQK